MKTLTTFRYNVSMEDKHAITVLLQLEKKYPLSEEEKEALSNAIGILSWSSLAESRMKNRKDKRTTGASE